MGGEEGRKGGAGGESAKVNGKEIHRIFVNVACQMHGSRFAMHWRCIGAGSPPVLYQAWRLKVGVCRQACCESLSGGSY